MERTQEPLEPADASLLPSRVQGQLSLALLAVLVAGAIAIVIEVAANGVLRRRDPGFLDAIFASDVATAAARVALLFAAGYVVASVVGLVVAGRWLTRLGPFEVSSAEVEYQQLRRALDRRWAGLASREAKLAAAFEKLGMIESDDEPDDS